MKPLIGIRGNNKIYNFIRALFAGQRLYRVNNKKESRIVFASSIEQCQSKFPKWSVVKIF